MATTDPVLRARAMLGVAQRDGGNVTEARQALAAAHVERAITKALAAAPPLTDTQRRRLAALLAPTAGGGR